MSCPFIVKSLVIVTLASKLASSSTFRVPLILVSVPLALIVTGPPPSVVVPVVVAKIFIGFVNVSALISSPFTVRSLVIVTSESKLASSSTFRVPLILVSVLVALIVTGPPPRVVVPVVVANIFIGFVIVSAFMSCPFIVKSLVIVTLASKLASSSTFRVPLILVSVPVALIVTGPPPRVVVPVVVANIFIGFVIVSAFMSCPFIVKSLVIVTLASKLASSSTFRVPLILVSVPLALIVTGPPPSVVVPVVVAKIFIGFVNVSALISSPFTVKSLVILTFCELSILIASFNDVPLCVDIIKSPFVSSLLPS